MAKCFVIIDPETGDRQYEIEGVGGVACDEITEALEQCNEVIEREYTQEFHNPELLPDYLHEEE